MFWGQMHAVRSMEIFQTKYKNQKQLNDLKISKQSQNYTHMNVLYAVILARHPIKSFFRTIESKMTSTSLKRSISSGFYPIICMCQECCGKGLNGCCSELSQDGGSDHTSQSAEVNVSALNKLVQHENFSGKSYKNPLIILK